MTQSLSPTSEQPQLPSAPSLWELLLLSVGFLFMYVPTFVALDKKVWSVVGQGHGPVMLALTLWLIWQRLPTLVQSVSRTQLGSASGFALLLIGAVAYAIGRSQSHFGLHVGSMIVMSMGLLLVFYGPSSLRVMWFPLIFSTTLVPLPGSLVEALTGPLKAGVSYVAEYVLHLSNYPIGRSGVTLTIGQYKLLVADACAGLNSIFALEAISIFYMSVVGHASKWRNVMLAVLVLPISFVSNVIRVVVLVLVTYYFGDEAGQGFVHGFAGILLFMVATALTIGVDSVLGFFFGAQAGAEKK
jgi:exosortase B